MRCPTCSAENPQDSRFCLACGNPMTPSQPSSPPSQPGGSGPVRTMRPLGGQPTSSQNPPPPPYGQQPDAFPPPQPAANYQQAPAQVYQQPQPPSPRPSYQQSYQPAQAQISSAQIATATLNIWGPFAGYGTRRRHLGWLMDSQAARYQDLLRQVNQRLQDRQIPDIRIAWKTLTARGVIVESRPYFLIQRGLVSLGLNIAPFGKDLFISMATYLKPPISTFRVLVFLAAITIQFFNILLLWWASNNVVVMSETGFFGATPQPNQFAIALICLSGPLTSLIGLILTVFFGISLYRFLKEKDILALLRVPPNEFNEDDLMALEKSVEQTIRSGLDDIGLNPADLKPAAVQGNETRLI
jgi:hypothetical protein